MNNLRSARSQASIVSAGLLLATTSSVAFAQPQPPSSLETGEISEIVVEASKIGASTERTPIAMTTLTAADLEKNRIQSIQDIQVRTPSLVFDTSSVFAQPYIRGMGSNFSLAGLETAVATYVDGVYQQRQAGAILDLVDLASVQILKGPQGTLYGRNATGGVILLQTADPQFDRIKGMVSGEYGRFDHRRVQMMLNVPVSPTLAVRTAGQIDRNDGYLSDVNTGGKRGQAKKHYLRGKILWKPTDEFSVTYGIEYGRNRSTGYAEREILPAPYCLTCSIYGVKPAEGFYQSTNSDNQFFKVRFLAHTLKLNYDGDLFNIASITGYRNQHVRYLNDQDFTGPDFFHSDVREGGPTFTNDTYLRTRFNSPLNGLVGFSVERERDKQDVDLVGDAFGSFKPHNFNKVNIDSFSVYGELTYKFSPGLKFTAGARYNHDRKRIDVVNDADAQAVLGVPARFTVRKTFRNLTPRAVLSYENDENFYYASYNRGARSGGFGSPVLGPAPAVAPETLDNFEIGAKNRWLDGRLKTTFAAFYGIYKDIQIQTVDSSTGSVILQNAARGKISGLELDASFAATLAFNINAGVTYLNNKFKKYEDAPIFVPLFDSLGNPLGIGSRSTDLSGTRLQRSPQWSGYAAVDYTLRFSNAWSLRASGIARMTGTYLFTPGAGGPLGIDRQKGYTTVDATLDVISPNEDIQIGVYAKNVFGKHYLVQALTAVYGAFVSPPMPSSYGIRATKRF